MPEQDLIIVDRAEPIAVVRMNRPKQLNALAEPLMAAVVNALIDLDTDPDVRCIVLAGSERVFAAGADIAEMASATPTEMLLAGRVEKWDAIRRLHTPLVAAVSGFCLGGGCELAMACDLIIASESAVFGQPETGLGIIPGAGGTQRLARAIGKAKAMDIVLTGRRLSAQEAEAAGLVARIVAREAWLQEAKRVAEQIAARAPIAQRLAKEAIDRGYETPLSAGLEFERKALYLSFASEDAREGLSAFIEKREPKWQFR
jgi:enoyl-CoA hydratase